MKDPKNKLSFKNLDSFCSYVQYLTAEGISEKHKFNDSELLKAHSGNSSLLIDKYVLCSIPTVQLEFLLESRGIFNYNADFGGFKRCLCINDNIISESFSPIIYAEHFNPYKRFQSCMSSASRTCRKVLDLAGLEINNISELDPHDNVFLDIVCTFPAEIDSLLLDPDKREVSINRFNKCRYLFFKGFESHYTYNDPDRAMGCNSSLHIWSSEFPFLPNTHVHNVIPAFSYFKNILRTPELYDIDQSLFDSVCFVDYSNIVKTGKGKIVYSDIKLKQKFIVDSARYKQLRLKLSNALREQLGFEPIVWFDSRFPVDSDFIKQLWSDIVKKEFKEFDFKDTVFDIHINFVPYDHKSKILHKLQYKSRPPVLDLDLFFRKLKKDFVTSYDSLDFSAVLDLLYYNLEIAVKCSNISDINRYESLLQKLEILRSKYPDSSFYNWLQFLCTWKTDTRVYGFWKHIKRYLLDPDFEILVESDICPVCGGDFTSIDNVDFCIVDCVIIRHRSFFMVFNFDGG